MQLHLILSKNSLSIDNNLNWILKHFPAFIKNFINIYTKKNYSQKTLPLTSKPYKSIKLFNALEKIIHISSLKSEFNLLINRSLLAFAN